jgi:hypothetical protein
LHSPYLKTLYPALSLLLVAACGSSNPVGQSCSRDTDCASGWCLSDPSFPQSYCSQLCDEDPTCPAGSVCHPFKNYKFCMASCSGDGQCREGYVCDYQVCRPRCTDFSTCADGHQCLDGHCKEACVEDSECPAGKRCHDGSCLPPCTQDSECLPDQRCDIATGKCPFKPGKRMGQPCGSSNECATGYCLPTRHICSVKCTGTSDCPRAYACGLEKVDKDKNGKFDNAEADCVPRKGSGKAGATCSKDADCASNHCYYGFCMEGCTTDRACASDQTCRTVNLLVGGGIPTYKGCLPLEGTSSYPLGTFPLTAPVMGFDVPPGTASYTLTIQTAGLSDYVAISYVKDPKGNTVSEVKGSCEYFGTPSRYVPDYQVSSVYVPNGSSVSVTPGIHSYAISGSQGSSAQATMTLQLKLGEADKGTLNLNWVFLNLAGTCVPGPTLNASTAPGHTWFNRMRNDLYAILKTANLKVGKQTFRDLNNPALDTIDLSSNTNQLNQLFATSKGTTGRAINVYFVKGLQTSSMGGVVLGIAGDIPGPPAIHGTGNSGVAMSMQAVCYEKYGYNPAHTLTHELGHFLGLFHNIENVTNPGFSETQNKIVCPCPCAKNMKCQPDPYKPWQSWCRGLDPLSDTQESTDNLMYYAAESTQMFKGNKLSVGQVKVILNNPLVGHR